MEVVNIKKITVWNSKEMEGEITFQYNYELALSFYKFSEEAKKKNESTINSLKRVDECVTRAVLNEPSQYNSKEWEGDLKLMFNNLNEIEKKAVDEELLGEWRADQEYEGNIARAEEELRDSFIDDEIRNWLTDEENMG